MEDLRVTPDLPEVAPPPVLPQFRAPKVVNKTLKSGSLFFSLFLSLTDLSWTLLVACVGLWSARGPPRGLPVDLPVDLLVALLIDLLLLREPEGPGVQGAMR